MARFVERQARNEAALALILAGEAQGGGGQGGFNIRPIGGGANDAPRVQATLAIAAALGVSVTLLGGLWTFTTTCNLPSGVDLYGTPETIIHATLPTGSFTDAAFLALPGALGASTTLSADAVVGSNVCHVTSAAGIAIGSILELDNTTISGNRGAYYRVINVAGTVITVERPILYAFKNTDAATVVSSIPTEINIYGNGMLFSGVCARYIEIAAARSCRIDNVRFDGSLVVVADIGISFDIGGYLSWLTNCTGDADGGAASTVFALESCESSGMWNVEATRSSSFGIQFFDCVECSIYESKAHGNASGFAFNSDGNTLGCQWCDVQGCHFDGNSGDGVTVSGATNNCVVNSSTANFNTGNGVTTSNTCFAVSLVNSEFADNANGIISALGSIISISDCDLSGNTAINLDASGFIAASGVTMIDALAAIRIYIRTGGDVRMTGLYLSDSTGVAANLIDIDPGQNGRLSISQSRILCHGAHAIVAQAGVINISETFIDGAIGILVAGGTVRIGPDVDASASTTPVNISSGFCNRFTQALAGAATTVVAWPDLKSTDNIQLQIQLKAGTLEAPYQITPNPGVGFTITPLGGAPALDTSTLEVTIL
jgi:hypothetical protein